MEPQRALAEDAADRPDAAPAALRRVLVADDSAVTRRVMAALVSTILPEAEITEAANGAETSQALRRQSYDIAFVDTHMPDMSGPRAVSLARRRGSAPFVVLMGDSRDEASLRQAYEIEAYEFLEKPLEEDELRLILANRQRMLTPSRVLIVDDSKTARRLMARVARASRFTMNLGSAASGEAALAALKRQPANVVFLDYDMPGIDGLETACLIEELMPAVRVVMVSVSQNPAVAKAARYFGAVHFLRKPFYAHQIDEAMHIAYDLPIPSLLAERVLDDPEGMIEDAAIPA